MAMMSIPTLMGCIERLGIIERSDYRWNEYPTLSALDAQNMSPTDWI